MEKRYALYFDSEKFVKRYDIEKGQARTTRDVESALKFDNFEEANGVADKLGGHTMVIEVTHAGDTIYCN
ncbi:hypothetical protein [Paenilisteria newyorkensis]|uniref:hypothetical protein n=1 Tax=Listeria newyorkensis TaxID=1497681 RepID=UPI00066A0094|nr:hypothetical protein [Listeria newyorkensis]KMT58909.1 hypothetical protein X559_2915 [Listeria newyorkensis]